jgi:hypothetical protein
MKERSDRSSMDALVSLSVKKTKWLDDRFFTFMTDSAAENKSLRATPPQ